MRCALDLTAVQTIFEKVSTLQRYNSSNTGRVNPFRVRFANMVTAMDAAVGEVVAALRARNMYENTLIAWFSDNVRWNAMLPQFVALSVSLLLTASPL